MRTKTFAFSRRSAVAAAALFAVLGAAAPASAADTARKMEHLDRGLVAIKVDKGIYLSWRFLGDEPDGITYRVYRDGARIAEVTNSTNYSDAAGQPTSAYSVAPMIGGVEGKRSADLTPMAQQYYDIPLQQPAPSVSPRWESTQRTLSGKAYEPVDMQLLRDVREPHAKKTGFTQAAYDAILARYRTRLGDAGWTPKTRFDVASERVSPGVYRISDKLYAEFEAAFVRYVDALDRGPKLKWLKNPDGSIQTQAVTYTPGDATVGDLDGDGDYELILKWNPSNAKDSSAFGSTAPTIIDAYQTDGTLLWRIDVGYNIRSGAHDTELAVADFNLDGKAELIIKTADGTRTGVMQNGKYVVRDVIGRAAATADKIQEYIAKGDEKALDEYYDGENRYAIAWVVPGGSTPADQNDRQWGKVYVNGVIGPSNEYLTAFDGMTGRVIDTIPFAFPFGKPNWGAAPVDHRGASFTNPVRDGGAGEPPQVPVSPKELPDPYWTSPETQWGYYPWGDHEGNRANRFNAGIAYLDGKRPSAIMGRGYYARSTVSAYNLVGKKLVLGPTFDSEKQDDPQKYHHLGVHSIMMADIDLDGKDEIIYGALVLKHDLKPQAVAGTWFPFPAPPPGVNLTKEMHNPDADDRFQWLGHGDAFHVGDFNPLVPGPEVFLTAEEPADFHSTGRDGSKGLGYRPSAAIYNPRTGEVMVGLYSLAGDLERGVAENIDPNSSGAEYWADGNVWSAITGEKLYANGPGQTGLSQNFLLYWDGDLQRELLNGNTISKPNTNYAARPQAMTVTNLLVAPGATGTGDGGRNSPIVSADLFGDWREEVVWRVGVDKLRVYTTTIPTEHKIRTLMHDPQYREGVASEGSVYNQPPHVSFFLDDDIKTYPLPKQRTDIDVSPIGAAAK
jgi:hypothetical protein